MTDGTKIPAIQAGETPAENLHSEFRIYKECGHRHTFAEVDAEDFGVLPPGVKYIAEVGLVCEDGYEYSVCRECCIDIETYQTLGCAEDHNHPCWVNGRCSINEAVTR